MDTTFEIEPGIIRDLDDDFTFEIISVEDGFVNCTDGSINWQLPVSDVLSNLQTIWEYADEDEISDDFPMYLEYSDNDYDYSGDIDSY